jgi:poly(A) polymerase
MHTPRNFPLSGHDVIALGIAPAEQVAGLLSAVHDWWVVGDFTADRASCLARLQEAVKSHRPDTTRTFFIARDA